jgi:dTDP-4-dehydrorhamnose 3,5-epimerase-like enzyme
MIGQLINFKTNGDERGSLIAIENNHNVPFDIKRVYYIFDTKNGVRRGFHAHKKLKQLCICVSGSCSFLLDDGVNKESIELNSPNQGLFIKGLVWREMYDFSSECVLMVLADEYYDESDYIRDYSSFLEEVKK